MPEAARIGDSVSTGHGCDATTTIAGALQSTVFINGIKAAVDGDALAAHTILSGSVCVPHSAVVNNGSQTVFIEGIKAARKDDSADADKITGHSTNVYIGGASVA
jgi:uncharacterized Zn-binding protein involved in type VI secretion